MDTQHFWLNKFLLTHTLVHQIHLSITITLCTRSRWFVQLYLENLISVDSENLVNRTPISELDHLSFWWALKTSHIVATLGSHTHQYHIKVKGISAPRRCCWLKVKKGFSLKKGISLKRWWWLQRSVPLHITAPLIHATSPSRQHWVLKTRKCHQRWFWSLRTTASPASPTQAWRGVEMCQGAADCQNNNKVR